MMVSSFGYRKARILQAHFDHGRLIILKIKLYDSSTLEQFNQKVDLFMLYLSSDCVGHTTVVDAGWITERPEQQKPDVNVRFVNGKWRTEFWCFFFSFSSSFGAIIQGSV